MHTANKRRRKRHDHGNPFFNQFFNDVFSVNLNDIIGSDFALNNPPVNIFETEEAFNMEIAAPGLEKEDFVINIEKDKISISAEKTAIESERKVNRREFDFGKFKRTFTIPKTVDVNGISAKHEHGVLKLTLPKKEEAKDPAPRTVEIS